MLFLNILWNTLKEHQKNLDICDDFNRFLLGVIMAVREKIIF